ncbi:MAG: hypothetical protein B7Y56_03525 [Gallionellales bacterium 35-53-114]|jgi:hypothetical protein|nr:MAG: hypothetical protein B7Y56_03525 [Gallionellales bacterium 35-53-114]OYZ65175.1 MAG: hypothetical protein B7Y04_00685 [Gallionellales bacterium 24-53-125]OZB08082.1 MAG: hypothetical protein B7X61_11135 [Gallionellales bacterium 39-52-133]HQS59989.1 hypothetical protein [Gallionellaceae bacterium]HQS76629.1 hypothetical protein [Gallionellaceae bacterium]
MAERISKSDRIRLTNRAEVEIMRYAKPDPVTGIRPHGLWHKHVHNAELDAMQVLKMIEMDQHPNTIDFSCRRTRKTSTKEIYNMEKLATSPALELGIVAPRQQQSTNNLNYMLEAIKRSPILTAYIAFNRGRQRLNDTGFSFANGSKAAAYGIMGQIDGDSLALASLEEVDDMPSDRLLSRFLPMLGASERIGMDIKIEPEIRISGVFKGADVLKGLINSGQYHVLPTVNVYMGLEMGIIGQAWVESMRAQQTGSEWMRQFLCLNISATNWIWEKHILKAKAVGLAAGLEIAEPLPGMRYRRRGLIAFGYDHLGHGESITASRSCLVVKEMIGNFVVTLRVRFWAADADEKDIERDLIAEWEYFRPDYAMGDAYGIGLMTNVNDVLYRKGLIEVDRMTIGDGGSSQSSWTQWAFSPIRFQGMTKHAMAAAVKSVYHSGRAAMPYFDDEDPACEDWRDYVRHLGNIKEVKGKVDYSSFKQVDEKLGDDGFDAECAAVWALQCRGAEDVATVIGTRTQTREQLMGMAA